MLNSGRRGARVAVAGRNGRCGSGIACRRRVHQWTGREIRRECDRQRIDEIVARTGSDAGSGNRERGSARTSANRAAHSVAVGDARWRAGERHAGRKRIGNRHATRIGRSAVAHGDDIRCRAAGRVRGLSVIFRQDQTRLRRTCVAVCRGDGRRCRWIRRAGPCSPADRR